MRNHSALTLLAMIAFAGNSIVVRLALSEEAIGPLAFSVIRLLAGAAVLTAICGRGQTRTSGSWQSAFCLLTYVVGFSFAYLYLEAGTGALILFATVQIVMIGSGLRNRERLSPVQWVGALMACVGLVFLLRPGTTSSPDALGATLMGLAGLGWAMYSLLGRKASTNSSPTVETAGNFVKASALILLGSVPLALLIPEPLPQAKGILWAVVSGAITSGLGYSLWYRVLRHLTATRAGIWQLSVPAIAALGGIVCLGETLTINLAVSTLMVLGGVATTILIRAKAN